MEYDGGGLLSANFITISMKSHGFTSRLTIWHDKISWSRWASTSKLFSPSGYPIVFCICGKLGKRGNIIQTPNKKHKVQTKSTANCRLHFDCTKSTIGCVKYNRFYVSCYSCKIGMRKDGLKSSIARSGTRTRILNKNMAKVISSFNKSEFRFYFIK